MSDEETKGTEKVEATEKGKEKKEDMVPAMRSVLLLIEKDEEGRMHPVLRSEGKTVTGTVNRPMHRGSVVIDAAEVPEGDSFRDLTYRIYDTRSRMVGSGRLREPGKYRFWVETQIDKSGEPTDGWVGRMEYEDIDSIRQKQRQLRLVSRGNPHAWQDVVVLEKDDGTQTIGVKFFDGSYVDAAGDLIEAFKEGKDVMKAPRVCMARNWGGRPLTGIWRLGKLTPKPLERILNYLGALHNGEDRFPLFEEHPELATVIRLGGSASEYEIVG